jgi:hypothetical protein
VTARLRKENAMKSNPVAQSIGEESPTFTPESGIAARAGTAPHHGTEPPDEDAQEEDSEPGTPAEPVQTPKNPGDA